MKEHEIREIVARRFGSRHAKPCANPQVLTCAMWKCQVADSCQKDKRASLAPGGDANAQEREDG